jgi:hypothetical protein
MIRMRNLPLSCCAVAWMAACSNTSGGGGGPAPVIASFAPDAASVAAGQSTTLRWSVANATTVSIDHGVGVVSANFVAVTPTDTTTYTLTAAGAGGTATAATTVAVRFSPPVISSFTATPGSIASGTPATLSWTVTNATALSIDQGVGDVTGRTSVNVSPSIDTTYTLTADGQGGRATRAIGVSVHSPLLHVQYVDPPAGSGKVRLVRNASSTSTHLILDLKVGGTAISGFGVALSLPIDGAKISFTPASGLIVNPAVLDVGSAPSTAAAALPSTGPLRNVLVLGVARKKQAPADGDVVFPADAILFSIALDMNGAPATGVIFTGSNLGTQFRAAVLTRAGAEGISKQEFAIGDLSISL